MNLFNGFVYFILLSIITLSQFYKEHCFSETFH